MEPVNSGEGQRLPQGAVIEQKRDGRTVLLVQETVDGDATVVETWDEALDLMNRILGRINRTLDQMNADRRALNKDLAEGIAATRAKVAENQRVLDKLIEDRQ